MGRLVQQPGLLQQIGYVPPAEAEAHYQAAEGTLPLAA
jgi:hypothetical protein